MSRAGSQVMNRGRRVRALERGSDDDDEEKEGGKVAETRSIIEDILSSSSGQMSGQWVKPK